MVILASAGSMPLLQRRPMRQVARFTSMQEAAGAAGLDGGGCVVRDRASVALGGATTLVSIARG